LFFFLPPFFFFLPSPSLRVKKNEETVREMSEAARGGGSCPPIFLCPFFFLFFPPLFSPFPLHPSVKKSWKVEMERESANALVVPPFFFFFSFLSFLSLREKGGMEKRGSDMGGPRFSFPFLSVFLFCIRAHLPLPFDQTGGPAPRAFFSPFSPPPSTPHPEPPPPTLGPPPLRPPS